MNEETPDITTRGAEFLTTSRTGWELLADPLLNKGTAFTEAERDVFGLHGLLPPHIGTLDEQASRRLSILRRFETDLERYSFLRELHDNNETLFFALLVRNTEELLPLVYTPTVGAGCQQFSQLFRKPRGLFLSLPHQDRLERILANPRFDRIEAIVVTDGERILGLGDQGVGGMGIPIGKLALYTALGGLHPATTLPLLLDVGTDNPERLADPLYLGWRHERVRGAVYDEFVEAVVGAITRRWPHVLLQWEDFAKSNASRLLERYRNRLCTFNDDIQGTAAVAAGTLLAAINVTGVPMAEQRIAILGAGSAGCGIARLLCKIIGEAGLSTATAAQRFFMVDRDGLLVEDMPGIEPFQAPFVQPKAAVGGWNLDHPDKISLLDVVQNAKPTALIGVSGQPGAFSEAIVQAMAEHNRRPAIFPLSNPTSRAEATPSEIDRWTEGRAVIGTGSPFPTLTRNGAPFRVDQTNNSYVFPGLALGAVAVKARRVSDAMLIAATQALAEASPSRGNPNGNLLPPVGELREAAFAVALASALAAHREGLTELGTDAIEPAIRAKIWSPHYVAYRPAEA